MTLPLPVRVRDYLLQRCNESVDGTHPMLVVETALNAREWCDGVVDDHADLLPWRGRAFQDCTGRVKYECIHEWVDYVRWNCMFVANGASSAARKDRLRGTCVCGNGPD